jgi:hypothetical protein
MVFEFRKITLTAVIASTTFLLTPPVVVDVLKTKIEKLTIVCSGSTTLADYYLHSKTPFKNFYCMKEFSIAKK